MFRSSGRRGSDGRDGRRGHRGHDSRDRRHLLLIFFVLIKNLFVRFFRNQGRLEISFSDRTQTSLASLFVSPDGSDRSCTSTGLR